MVGYNLVINVGEITCRDWKEIDTEKIARRVVKEVGYDHERLLFWNESFEYLSRIHGQSPDISQGVSEGEGLYKEQGAGDQGMMFGYAVNENEEMLPSPIAYSHRILRRLEKVRKAGEIPYLRPDAKSQVSIQYKNGRPVEITSIVVSHQTDDISLKRIRDDIIDVVQKDPSKVDRSAAYYARYAAKNIVAAGLAEKCEIQIAYAIGVARPLSINIDTYGTGAVSDEALQDLLVNGDIFDFRPAAIIDQLGLLYPNDWSYQQTAAYGHFGREEFPWEKTDKAQMLRERVEERLAA